MVELAKKVCIIGDFGVGKTSLIRRFVDRQFSDHYLSTLGVKISRKELELPKTHNGESAVIKLLIWDIEGQTKFQEITPAYLQGASGIIVVADLNRWETIQHLPAHLALVSSLKLREVVTTIALNKSDLIEPAKLETLVHNLPLQDHTTKAATYLTSAKTGDNVDVIFQKLARSMLKED